MKAFINSTENFYRKKRRRDKNGQLCYSHDGHDDVGGQMKTETQMFML